MKKSSLTTAVLAGLAGVVGFAGSAGAVNLNMDGTGQVLIYPYYTTRADQSTLISVVNSTEAGKAVKVRFLEGYNSMEVRDFNLFMSAYDVWTGAVVELGDRAGFMTADTSCTMPTKVHWKTDPAIPGNFYVDFTNQAYAADGGPTGLDRTREGYVELIQMADIDPLSATYAAVEHVQTGTPMDGVPANCGSPLLDNANVGSNPDFTIPTGGLFGSGQIISVDDGTLYAYNADAIQGFNTVLANVTASGSMDPSLKDAQTSLVPLNATAHVVDGATLYSATYSAERIDAVSAVFMARSVMNEWVADAGFSGSDWVVTFPTKRFYVNTPPVARAPFSEVFHVPGLSCDEITVDKFDREELKEFTTTTPPFSPPPPDQPSDALCHEVNVISFSETGDSILGSSLALNVQPFGPAGWMKLNLGSNALPASDNGVVFRGLPATGFWAVRYTNGTLSDADGNNVLSNYGGAFRHRIQRDIAS